MLSPGHLSAFVSRPGGTKYEEILLGGTESTGGQGLLLLFTILIILFNLLLILLIVCSSSLRQSTKHVLIINVAVGDLVMGVLVCPLLMDIAVQQDWVFNCHLYNTLTLFRTSLIPSVTCLALFLINLFYILRITSDNIHTPKKAEVVMPISLGFSVWLLSIIVLVPLYFGATVRGNSSMVHRCSRVVYSDSFALLYVSLSYIPQAFCILASAFLMVYVHTPGYLAKNLLYYGARIQVPLDAVLVTFISLACYTPFFILEFASITYNCENRKDCRLLHMGNQVTVWLVLAKSFIVPVCWLACKDIRRAIKCTWCG